MWKVGEVVPSMGKDQGINVPVTNGGAGVDVTSGNGPFRMPLSLSCLLVWFDAMNFFGIKLRILHFGIELDMFHQPEFPCVCLKIFEYGAGRRIEWC